MNIKRNIFAMLAAAVLLASCSQDEVMTDTGPDGLVPVTLSAAVGDGVQTRATTTDEGPLDRCLIQILEKEKDEAEWTKGAVRKMDEANGTYTLTNIMLNPEKDYTFLFWADGGMSYYTATDLTDVTIASETGKAGIAYQTSEVWDGGDNIEVELTHAVTKVSLQSTTVVPTSKTIDITIPKKYSSFNVLEGKVSGDATTYTHSSPGSGSDGDQFFFYALVEDATQNLTLNAGGGDVNITSVPLGPNKHVILRGDVDGAGWTTVNFTASVQTTWGSTPTEIIGLEIADGGTTYIVSSPAAFEAWATEVQSDLSLNCTLADDITLPVVTDGGSNWTPIQGYAGTFDGGGKTITGLTINKSTMNVGLFASIVEGGTVKNLKLDKVNVTANSNVGAVAGQNKGTIENCSVSGSVTSLDRLLSVYIGGIVGQNDGTITGCTVEGSVKAKDADTAGGIAGFHNNGSITDCHSSATVEGLSRVGGIAGKSNASITACSSIGDVTATKNSMDYSWAGGVVGEFTGRSQLIACYATGNVKGDAKHVGGVVGDNVYNAVIACYATGSVTGASGSTGGVVGRNFKDDFSSGTVTACYWDNNQSSGIGEDQTNNGGTTKVEGSTTWETAMNAMNVALTNAGTDWRYVTGSDGVPLTLQRQN